MDYHGVKLLNNREIASLLWGIVLLLIILKHALEDRTYREDLLSSMKLAAKSFGRLIFTKNILPLYLYLVFFTMGVLLLFRIGFIKTREEYVLTAKWTFISAFLYASKSVEKPFLHTLKRLLIRHFQLSAIFSFISNAGEFPLIVEILILPILFISLFIHFTSSTFFEKFFGIRFEDQKPMKLFAQVTIIFFGVVYVTYGIIHVVSHGIASSIYQFLLAYPLTIAVSPALYILALYSTYEQLFLHMNCFIHPSERHAFKILLLSRYHFNIFSLQQHASKIMRYTATTPEITINSFRDFLRTCEDNQTAYKEAILQ
jgi:hypothetical protein